MRAPSSGRTVRSTKSLAARPLWVDQHQSHERAAGVKADASGNWIEIGIVSWGQGCAEAGYPGVYGEVQSFSDNIKAAEACHVTMWGSAWHSDYPDGENFMQLFYGPNTHQSNHACYRSAAFDKFYDQMRVMPNSPERDRLFLMMSRQLEVDSVIKLGSARYRNVLIYPQVKGFRWHPIVTGIYELLDIDNSARRQ